MCLQTLHSYYGILKTSYLTFLRIIVSKNATFVDAIELCTFRHTCGFIKGVIVAATTTDPTSESEDGRQPA